MKSLLITLLIIQSIQNKLPTAKFQISFKGVSSFDDILSNKGDVQIDQGDQNDFKKVDVDLKIDNGSKHLRALLTCNTEAEHVNIVLMKDEENQSVNIKLVPGKGTEFYMEDFPLNSVDVDENKCEVTVNKSRTMIKQILFIVSFFIFIQLNF